MNNISLLLKIKKAYLSFSILDDTSIGTEMKDVKKRLETEFYKIRNKLESLPVTGEIQLSTMYCILSEDGKSWIPVISGVENSQYGLAYSVQDGEHVANGSCLFGNWSSVGAENELFINIDFEEFLKIDDLYLR